VARKNHNDHHILHHAKQHEATPDNHWLRTKALGMIACMDIDAHDALHKACPGVPPLDIWTAQRVRRLYVPNPNPLIAIENYMRAVETASDHPKSHFIERQLSDLAIHAVDLQRPFIREGLIYGE
jgi:hypothetical protein